MITLKAKDYASREALEVAVKDLVGLTSDTKSGYEISGTDKELEALSLSRRSILWGVRCSSTDKVANAPPRERPARGELHDFGINGNLKKQK